ncbi:MAG: glycosyltransferase family 4 protein [Bacteroidia bacterium]|nr:glycosyltransferase family 4 protein [Bacteroidia bacterium]
MSKKGKILVFIDWYYPAYKAGGPVQSCLNLIERLGDQFEFKVVTSNKEYLESDPLPDIAADQWLTGPFGEQVIYLSEAGNTAISRILEKEMPDFIWLNSMFSSSFSILPLRLWKGKVLLSPRGMLAPEALRLKRIKKQIFLKLSALSGWHKNVVFHATNTEEERQIKKWFPDNEIRIAPNFSARSTPLRVNRKRSAGETRLVMLARIAPEKNNLFALELLKSRKPIGQITMDLYGAEYDKVYAEKCRSIAARMPEGITVRFMGTIEPGKVQEMFQNYDFLLFPSRGENYGHAIVQAWSAGTPVIISDATPWKDLENNSLGWEIPLEEERKWQEVLSRAETMPDAEFNSWSSASIRFASSLSNDPQTLVLNQNLFRL